LHTEAVINAAYSITTSDNATSADLYELLGIIEREIAYVKTMEGRKDGKVRDAKGDPITVGCKVSDGLAAGTVTKVDEDQVHFTVEGVIGKYFGRSIFNRPENLLVISDKVWKEQVG
jgi:hypothetical protein